MDRRRADRRHELAMLLDRLARHDDEAVDRALQEAEQRYHDPVDAGGAALLSLLRTTKVADVDLGATSRWKELRPGVKAMLMLIEVEQIPIRRVARLLHVGDAEVRAGYAAACRAVGWEPLHEVSCAGWPTVARLHRVGTEDGQAGIVHLDRCPKCAIWHFERQDRREMLAQWAPWIGASGLGYVLDPRSI